MEKILDLTILCKIRTKPSGKVMRKVRLSGKVVVLTIVSHDCAFSKVKYIAILLKQTNSLGWWVVLK